MSWFSIRRLFGGAMAIITFVFIACLVRHQEENLRQASFTSGYFLAAGILFLALYNVRKRITGIPVGSSTAWLQLHIYIGFVMIATFVLHTGVRSPNGVLESILFGVFVALAGSGLYGLYITRTIPRRLTKLRVQVIYERIPRLREEIRREAHRLMVMLVRSHDAPTMGDYYTQRLVGFFHKPRPWWYYVSPTGRLRNKLRSELSDRTRYFSSDEKQASQKMARLIDRRDDVDYHDAMQSKLRFWLFAHISMTYALLVFAAIHVALAHAFHGGMR